MADPTPTSDAAPPPPAVPAVAALQWDALPDILTPGHLKDLFQVKRTKTISHWWRTGQLPKPCLNSGNVVRWRKQDVQDHLARRMRMG